MNLNHTILTCNTFALYFGFNSRTKIVVVEYGVKLTTRKRIQPNMLRFYFHPSIPRTILTKTEVFQQFISFTSAAIALCGVEITFQDWFQRKNTCSE